MATKKATYTTARRPVRMSEGALADTGEEIVYDKGQYYMERKESKAGAGRGFINPPMVNSREQYAHEREAGDPNAMKLSFEEWKKL